MIEHVIQNFEKLIMNQTNNFFMNEIRTRVLGYKENKKEIRRKMSHEEWTKQLQ